LTKRTAFVMGMGVTGQAVAAHLRSKDWDVVGYDDKPTAVDVLTGLSDGDFAARVRAADLVVVSPGVPAGHRVYDAGAKVISEIELASRDAPMPIVAVTGTNGKTTVTTMIAAMLDGAIAAGNIGLPLITAVSQPADVIVAEVSSFQLQFTEAFHPTVAVWLNFAEDHLDWHPTLDHYAAAKARIWANQTEEDTAVVNADDEVVMKAAATAPAHVVTFGDKGEWRLEGRELRMPDGGVLLTTSDLPRALPHDVANALAAAAAATAAGASLDSCRSVLTSFAGLPHRVQLVSDAGGVRWYDDSKATTPASVVAALKGFDSVVLIAGGRNKGMDLRSLAAGADSIRAVVAIGDAAAEVEAAFDGVRPVTVAGSMKDAVDAAERAARPGDVVLLSPGCASFDWYRNYAERGDDFGRLVRERADGQ
jgi:UDP-N-acetylmuramoylalanine--D-glutamate ligase